MPHPYDSFATIYAAWTESAPVAVLNQRFYRDLYVEAAPLGPVVELGVGDGRIALEACAAGVSMIGVDASGAMLDLCRKAAADRGLSDGIALQQADFRDFELARPATLITIPFHSIGHLTTLDDKLDALRHIRANLLPDGRFVFDHFVADPSYAPTKQRAVLHRASFDRPADGLRCHLYEASTYDLETQLIRVLIRADTVAADGSVSSRYSEIELSWVTPEQSRELLGQAGFRVESVFGGFEGEHFTRDSTSQVWIARAN